MRVVIVGGGAAGVVTAIALVRRLRRGDVVDVVEPRLALGEGIAYSTSDPGHLLNVPALLMSAFEDDQTHFVRYLSAHGIGGALTYAPRAVYGEYLRTTLRKVIQISPVILRHIRGTATDIWATTSGPIQLQVTPERWITADHVVLCLGQGSPIAPPQAPTGSVVVAWSTDGWERAVSDLGPDVGPVAVIGTGLSAADTVVSIARRGVPNITAFSRRGRFPAAHLEEPEWPDTGPLVAAIAKARCASEVIQRVRRAAAGAGDNWRSVIDGIRPILPELWAELPSEERERLTRHALPMWESHRHRMPPQTASTIASLIDARILRVFRGSASIAPNGQLSVLGAGGYAPVDAARVFVCMGSSHRPQDVGMGLVATLIRRGLVMATTAALIVEDGRVAGPLDGRLWAVGAVTSGFVWENFAVSVLRRQGHEVADAIGEKMTQSVDR